MKIAIVGAGKLGLKITEALLSGDHSVIVIDQDENVLQRLSDQMDVMTVNANAEEIKVLKSLGISTYDYLIAVTGSDQSNMLIAFFAKKMGCAKVLARTRTPEHMRQREFVKKTMEIDFIINPDLAISEEIYKYLVEKYTLSNGIFSSGKITLLEFDAVRMPELIGKNMAEAGLILHNMLVVGISRNGKVIIPHKEAVILQEDNLYVVGERGPAMKLNARVHEKGKYTDLQKVMILGGGTTAFYLANMLSEFGAAVKIIEINKDRCRYLASRLGDVMILHGDATDLELLEEENIGEMDAVVTVTGYDEENLLLALMAKRRGIEDVIAKVSRKSYADIVENMGVDMALNPVDITASNILRFMQGSKRVISSQLIQGQAEIAEINISNHALLVDKALKDLNLPNGLIVAAIHRGQDIIIPNGDTVIKENDRVIIFSLLTELPNLEKLLKVSRKMPFFS